MVSPHWFQILAMLTPSPFRMDVLAKGRIMAMHIAESTK